MIGVLRFAAIGFGLIVWTMLEVMMTIKALEWYEVRRKWKKARKAEWKQWRAEHSAD